MSAGGGTPERLHGFRRLTVTDLLRIFEYVAEPPTIARIASVCQHWNTISTLDSLWMPATVFFDNDKLAQATQYYPPLCQAVPRVLPKEHTNLRYATSHHPSVFSPGTGSASAQSPPQDSGVSAHEPPWLHPSRFSLRLPHEPGDVFCVEEGTWKVEFFLRWRCLNGRTHSDAGARVMSPGADALIDGLVSTQSSLSSYRTASAPSKRVAYGGGHGPLRLASIGRGGGGGGGVDWVRLAAPRALIAHYNRPTRGVAHSNGTTRETRGGGGRSRSNSGALPIPPRYLAKPTPNRRGSLSHGTTTGGESARSLAPLPLSTASKYGQLLGAVGSWILAPTGATSGTLTSVARAMEAVVPLPPPKPQAPERQTSSFSTLLSTNPMGGDGGGFSGAQDGARLALLAVDEQSILATFTALLKDRQGVAVPLRITQTFCVWQLSVGALPRESTSGSMMLSPTATATTPARALHARVSVTLSSFNAYQEAFTVVGIPMLAPYSLAEAYLTSQLPTFDSIGVVVDSSATYTSLLEPPGTHIAGVLQAAVSLLVKAQYDGTKPLLVLAAGQESLDGNTKYAALAAQRSASGEAPLTPPLSPALIAYLLRSSLAALRPILADRYVFANIPWCVQGCNILGSRSWGANEGVSWALATAAAIGVNTAGTPSGMHFGDLLGLGTPQAPSAVMNSPPHTVEAADDRAAVATASFAALHALMSPYHDG